MPYTDPEKKREAARRYRAKYLEKERARKREYMADRYPADKAAEACRRWREKNPEYFLQPEHTVRSQQWKKANPARTNANTRKRELTKRRACPPWVDHTAILKVYSEAARLTAETGVLHHVDHIIPLTGKSVNGLHVSWNLQVIPATDNLRKSNKVPTT